MSTSLLDVTNDNLLQRIIALFRETEPVCKKVFFFVILFFIVSISISALARIITFSTQTHIIDTAHINIGEGHTNIIEVSPTMKSKVLLSALADSNEYSNQSKTILLEDGQPLQLAHAQHSEIQLKGLGQYSHWHNSILFSTSDNTDPHTNGRTYAAIFDYTFTGWLIALISLLITGSFIFISPKIQRTLFFQTFLVTFENIAATTSFWVLLGSCLFLIPLLNAWLLFPIKPTTDILYGALGGYIPWSDAAFYYWGAEELINGDELNYFNLRRPLNAILLAVRLWVSNNDFESALILQALMCGISVGILGSTVNKSFGKIAAIGMIIPLFAFGICYVPTTLSETLGLTIGCLAFVLLWQGIREKNTFYTFFGCFTLTMGLSVRAGAFIILPILALWLGREFRNSGKKYNWKILILGICAILLGFAFNALLGKLHGNSAGQTHANFAYVLYGLAAGGKDWTYVYQAFPELLTANITEREVATFLYQKAITSIIQQPYQLITGLNKNLFSAIEYLLSFFKNLFSAIVYTLNFFTTHFSTIIGIMISFALFLLCIFRFIGNFKSHQKALQFILVGILGNLLSTSFIWLNGGIRTFATTLPFYAVFNGILFALLAHSQLKAPPSKKILHDGKNEAKLALVFCGTILILGCLGPYLIRFPYLKNATIISHTAPPNQKISLLVRNFSKSPKITILPNNMKFQPNLLKHKMSAKTFLENLPEWSENYNFFKKLFDPQKFSKPITLSLLYDSNTRQIVYVLDDNISEIDHGINEVSLPVSTHIPFKGLDNITPPVFFLPFYFVQPK